MKLSEEEIIAKYLIGIIPDERDKMLYQQALGVLKPSIISKQQYLWNIALAHPRFLPCLDAGLAILEPQNPIRLKIYIMLAVLETNPNYFRFFINEKRPASILNFIYAGSSALIRITIGFCIVKSLLFIYNYRYGKTA